MHIKPRLVSPGRILLFSIVCMITLGTFLLTLPGILKANADVTLFDLLFTATSATCVTGLLTISLDHFTIVGHGILLLLIQVGGLGLITLTVFLMSLFINVGLGTQLMAGQLLEIDRYRTSRSMIGFIIIFSIIIEAIGAIAIFFTLSEGPLYLRVFQAVFHSVSSFCSAGFVIFPQKMVAFRTNIPFLLITSTLMLIGELGFIVWHDLLSYAKAWYDGRVFRCSLHTKIVLNITFALIVLSAISLWALEHKDSFGDLPFVTAVTNIIFNTISFRSTGFNTLDISSIHLATFFMIMIIAFIGSSPGSTGSGIKTTTFAIFLAAIHSVIAGRTCIEIKNRTIPNDQVFKAMAVLALALSWLACITFCLLISEEGWRFVDIMFEAFSAFANLGLSTDFTPYLSYIGKAIVMVSMLVGRIGSITLILALKGRVERTEFHYPEERVLIS